MNKEIELDRLEKASTLLRNVVLIIGALITAALFLADKLSSEVEVHALTLYLGGDNTIISTPTGIGENSKILSGPLGTLSQVRVTNKSKLPVHLEVRIPKSTESETSSKWPQFTTVSTFPLCHLKNNEIKISGEGVLLPNNVGSIEIDKFPPDCVIEVVVSSTKVDENTRFMSGQIEVFYDGKKAEIDKSTQIYGWLGGYLGLIERSGFIGVLALILFPIISLLLLIVWLMETLPNKKKGVEGDSNI